MDGNRRWARERGLPIFFGHDRGFKKINEIASFSRKIGVKYLTLWAFSTENWHREEGEVSYLLNLFRKNFRIESIKKMQEEGIKIKVLGDLTAFPKDIKDKLEETVSKTRGCRSMTLNVALNYGGRDEIVRAVNKILEKKYQKIDDYIFKEFLDTAGQPDPDLIIRTGGEFRLSGFLPWQSIYSELYFTKIYWPDFGRQELTAALKDYSSRQRRFGR